MSVQHGSLGAERWGRFSLDQQILMIGNEMNRASKLLAPEHHEGRQNCYHRVLDLLDLTVAVNPRPALRRELLRWRDLIAELYISPDPDPTRHRAAFRSLLQFTPAAAQQIPYLLA